MRLLAVYIKEKDALYKNICFSFTGSCQVEYEDGRLYIQEEERRYVDFYGKEIQDITVVVGKNGSGKTTLLDLIGSPYEERSGRDGEQYFLLYETEPNRYMIERMGDFAFTNIEGADGEDLEQWAGAFYFQKEGNRMWKIEKSELSRVIRDRIVYFDAGKRYVDVSGNLWMDQQIAQRWLPRVKNRIGRLECWYDAYLDLYREKIIESETFLLLFPVNEHRRRSWKSRQFDLADRDTETEYTAVMQEWRLGSPEAEFSMKSREEVNYGELPTGFLHHRESFDDCLTNHINMAVRLFLIELKWISEDMGEDFFWGRMRELREKYSRTIAEWSEERIQKLFQELLSELEEIQEYYHDNGDLQSRRETCSFLMRGLRAYCNFYRAVFDARDMILPGIDLLGVKMHGNCEEPRIRRLLQSYDKLEDFYESGDENQMDRLYLDVLPQISAGEEKMISIIGNLHREIQRDVGLVAMADIVKPKTILYVIDEIERDMHLEWSRRFLAYLIRYLSKYRFKIDKESWSLKDLHIQIQLVMSTHSPFLLSDLHERSIIELERDGDGAVRQHRLEQKVFAQNIQRILLNDFFISHGFGEFAEQKLQEIISCLNGTEEISREEQIRCWDLIEEVGEPIVKRKLSWMYRSRFGVNGYTN